MYIFIAFVLTFICKISFCKSLWILHHTARLEPIHKFQFSARSHYCDIIFKIILSGIYFTLLDVSASSLKRMIRICLTNIECSSSLLLFLRIHFITWFFYWIIRSSFYITTCSYFSVFSLLWWGGRFTNCIVFLATRFNYMKFYTLINLQYLIVFANSLYRGILILNVPNN